VPPTRLGPARAVKLMPGGRWRSSAVYPVLDGEWAQVECSLSARVASHREQGDAEGGHQARPRQAVARCHDGDPLGRRQRPSHRPCQVGAELPNSRDCDPAYLFFCIAGSLLIGRLCRIFRLCEERHRRRSSPCGGEGMLDQGLPVHPRELLPAGDWTGGQVVQSMERTPIYDRHVEAGARMAPFDGWEMPVQYGGVSEEHRAVRSAAGLFDVSHMGEIETSGPQALEFLQHVLSNDVTKVPVDASVGKLAAVRAFAATVHQEGDSVDTCVELAKQRAAEAGYVFVHPFDDLDVVAGQAGVGLEILEDTPELATVVVPIGGGGLGAPAATDPLAPARSRRSPMGSRSSVRGTSRCRWWRRWSTSPCPERHRPLRRQRRHRPLGDDHVAPRDAARSTPETLHPRLGPSRRARHASCHGRCRERPTSSRSSTSASRLKST
jgi:hypothetical protein